MCRTARISRIQWHGAVGRLSADGRAQDGTVGQLELQTVRRHPEQVTLAEKKRPDGSEEKANEQRLGRRRGGVQHTAFQPHNKGQRKWQALPALGRRGGDSKSPNDGQLTRLQGGQAGGPGHPGQGSKWGSGQALLTHTGGQPVGEGARRWIMRRGGQCMAMPRNANQTGSSER